METPLKFTDRNSKLSFTEMGISLKIINWGPHCGHSVSARAYVCKRKSVLVKRVSLEKDVKHHGWITVCVCVSE